MKKGKFIVICGTDGSGKTTQFQLLVERMSTEGYPIETVDFPQYGKPSAFFVEKYLNGGYGTKEQVGPYRASVFYALDRYDKSADMHMMIAQGKNIVANRYVSASKGHQACAIDDAKERNAYLDWLDNLEFNIFGIPKPDLTIILYVPPEIGQQLVEKKTTNREYLKGGKTKDINEADLNHLKKASQTYLEMVEKYDDWVKIDCVKDGQLMSPKEVSELVWEKVNVILSGAKDPLVKKI